MISLKALWDAFQKHTHTLTSLGAAAANHTHTLQSLDAAAAGHTHTLTSLGAAAANHTHTLQSLDAAAAGHTHTLQSLGAAAANHTHTAASLGVGLELVANAKGAGTMTVDITGKTMGILYIYAGDRWYPVTFAVSSVDLGVNMIYDGGEDAIVRTRLVGNNLTLTAAGSTAGLGRLYLM